MQFGPVASEGSIKSEPGKSWDDVAFAFSTIEERLSTVRDIITEAGRSYLKQIELAFNQESEPPMNGGNPWQELSPVTIATRSALGVTEPDHPILRRFGTLIEDATRGFREVAAGIHGENYAEVTIYATSLTSGQNYAAIHEYGSQKVVARRFLPNDIMMTKELARIAEAYLGIAAYGMGYNVQSGYKAYDETY